MNPKVYATCVVKGPSHKAVERWKKFEVGFRQGWHEGHWWLMATGGGLRTAERIEHLRSYWIYARVACNCVVELHGLAGKGRRMVDAMPKDVAVLLLDMYVEWLLYEEPSEAG